MKNLLRHIQDFFGISPAESRGALVLIVLSLGLVLVPTVVKWWVLPMFQNDTVPFTIKYLDSTAALIPESGYSFGEESNYESKKYADRNSSEPSRPTRLFPFDPNTATPDQLQELGIPKFLALRIDKYRQKGGKFRKKEDLKKIYDFPPALFTRLEGYINLPDNGQRVVSATAGFDENPRPEPAGAAPFLNRENRFPARPAPTAFDINTADTSQLAALRGIGSKLSARIVKYRDALGGFHSPDQFAEIYGLDSTVLVELRRYGRLQTTSRKININTATADELYRHPYFRNRKLNEVVIRYREQHGPYPSAESLKAIRILDDATLRKWEPYLSF